MANQVIAPRPKPPVPGKEIFLVPRHGADDAPTFTIPEMHEGMLRSLFNNVKELLFPEKLPPLRLTSRPVPVREIWTRGTTKRSTTVSLVLHSLAIVGLIAISIIGARKVMEKPHENVTVIAPPLTDYQPVMQPKIAPKQLADRAATIYAAHCRTPQGEIQTDDGADGRGSAQRETARQSLDAEPG
jgi:hypothetical protein